MNFPSYTFWHLSFKAAHNISPPVCHPSVELYQLPCSNLKQTDSILFLLSSSPTLLPPASHTVPDLQITPELLPYSCHSKTPKHAAGSRSRAGSNQLCRGSPQCFTPLWNPPKPLSPTAKHHPTRSHRPTHYSAVLLSSQNRNGYVSSLSQKADAFSFMSHFCYPPFFFFFYQPGSFLVDISS